MKTIMQKIRAAVSNREVILYLVFGVLTTAVDWLISFILYRTEMNLHLANTLAWVGAVLFAYVTNRIWVFESRKTGIGAITLELIAFAGGRVATLLMQEGIFVIFCDLLKWNEYVIKIAAAVLVVIGNYIISKLLVFRQSRRKERKE